jgi:hypothetical protein
MAASENPDREWETQAEVDVCLGETGVTRDQVNRWRREGLLPPVVQKPTAYHGSEVCYPTCGCEPTPYRGSVVGSRSNSSTAPILSVGLEHGGRQLDNRMRSDGG